MTSLLSHEFTSPVLASADASRKDQLRHRPVYCGIALLAADGLAAIGASVPVISCTRILQSAYGTYAQPPTMSVAGDLPVLLLVVFAYLAAKGRYTQRIPFWSECRLVASAALWAVGLELLLGILLHDLAERMPTVMVFALLILSATMANRIAKLLLVHVAAWTVPVLLLGDGPGADSAEAALQSDRSLGYRIIGRLDPATILSMSNGPRLSPVLDRSGGSRLLIAVDGDGSLQRQLVECALRERVPFSIVPAARAMPSFACETSRFFSHDAQMLVFRDGLSRAVQRAVKAATDMGLAALLLALVSPFFLIIAVTSWRSGGPIFFAQSRVGAGGRPFKCLKFRTMVVDSDRVLQEAVAADPALAAEWAASRKLARDPRVTPLGRFLRKTSLDELPQLINVLRRDMSLVGPRPIVESEVCLYGDDIAQYYATRPGLTGLWQVSGRSTTSYARRVQLDVWYVNNWTIWNDFAVLLKTIPVVLRCDGAW